MIMLWLAIGLLAGTTLALGIGVRRLLAQLWTVRMATYELTTMLSDDVADLQDSLQAVGISLLHPRLDERMRRNALSPEARHAESVARFEAAAAKAEELGRRLRDDPEP